MGWRSPFYYTRVVGLAKTAYYGRRAAGQRAATRTTLGGGSPKDPRPFPKIQTPVCRHLEADKGQRIGRYAIVRGEGVVVGLRGCGSDGWAAAARRLAPRLTASLTGKMEDGATIEKRETVQIWNASGLVSPQAIDARGIWSGWLQAPGPPQPAGALSSTQSPVQPVWFSFRRTHAPRGSSHSGQKNLGDAGRSVGLPVGDFGGPLSS